MPITKIGPKHQVTIPQEIFARLRLEVMEDPRDIWEGRITRGYRFTCQIVGETYRLRRIGTHDVLRRP